MKVETSNTVYATGTLSDTETRRVVHAVLCRIYGLGSWQYINEGGYLESWENTHGAGMTTTGPKATPRQVEGFRAIRALRAHKEQL